MKVRAANEREILTGEGLCVVLHCLVLVVDGEVALEHIVGCGSGKGCCQGERAVTVGREEEQGGPVYLDPSYWFLHPTANHSRVCHALLPKDSGI